MKYVNLSVARSSLPSLVDDTERVVITRGGQPVAVLVNIDDYRAMQIMQTLAAEPSTLQRIMQTHERVRSGDLEGLEEFPLPEGSPDRRGLKDRSRAAAPQIADVIDQMKEAVREEKQRMRALKKVDDATIEKTFLELDRRLSKILDRGRRLTEADTIKSR